MLFENYVAKAVWTVGGPTKASNALGCSNASVHSWIKAHRVPDIDKARKLAALANMPVERIRPC